MSPPDDHRTFPASSESRGAGSFRDDLACSAGWVLLRCSSEGISLLLTLLADLRWFPCDLLLDLGIVRALLPCLVRLLESCLSSVLSFRAEPLPSLLVWCLVESSLSRGVG